MMRLGCRRASSGSLQRSHHTIGVPSDQRHSALLTQIAQHALVSWQNVVLPQGSQESSTAVALVRSAIARSQGQELEVAATAHVRHTASAGLAACSHSHAATVLTRQDGLGPGTSHRHREEQAQKRQAAGSLHHASGRIVVNVAGRRLFPRRRQLRWRPASRLHAGTAPEQAEVRSVTGESGQTVKRGSRTPTTSLSVTPPHRRLRRAPKLQMQLGLRGEARACRPCSRILTGPD